MFKEFRDTGNKYKQRIRSRVSNLGDLKNPSLKHNVMTGTVPPDKIATMTTEVGRVDDVMGIDIRVELGDIEKLKGKFENNATTL